MRKLLLLLSLLSLLTTNVFAHAGEVHKYMGTIATVDANGSFTLKTTAGKSVKVEVSKATSYRFADGSVAKSTDLQNGRRVVATISKDGKTASEIKLAVAKK